MYRSTLTILFQDPFWIGLYEREDNGQYQVCRIVFGAEPRDQEVYLFLLENWRKLRFSPAVAGGLPPEAIRNPQAQAERGPKGDPDRRDRHQGPASPEAPAGAGKAGAESPVTAGKRGRGGPEIPAPSGKAAGEAQGALGPLRFFGYEQ